MLKQLRFSHELDAAWIIALWKAIHGGDPTPEQIAAQAIAALATQLSPRTPIPAREEGFEQLKSRLAAVGLQISEHAIAAPAAPAGAVGTAVEADAIRPPQTRVTRYCFHTPQGQVCAEIVHQVFQRPE